MKTVHVLLDSIDKVKGFVNTISTCEGDFDLTSSRYVIDAKSVMGWFSLDLSSELRLMIHSEECNEMLEKLKNYLID